MMSIHYKYEKECEILYFKSTYCKNDAELMQFNKYKILCDEIVSFDAGLFEMQEVLFHEIITPTSDFQYLAMIRNPAAKRSEILAQDHRFVFAGYDLVEEFSGISAITNCGGSFEEAINYGKLNQFGLFSDYDTALKTKRKLETAYPDEPHADCEIVEIWRYADH